MEVAHKRAERFFVRLTLGGLIGLVLLIALIWGGHDAYVHWQERRLVRLAQYDMAHEKYNAAALAARAALQIKPSSLGAIRIMAELGEKAGDKTALDWRRRAVELAPGSTNDLIAWAGCALLFNDIDLAEKATQKISAAGRNTAEYHAIMAAIAVRKQDPAQAEREWAEAARINPTKKEFQFQLALIALQSPQEDRHAQAVATLTALRSDAEQRAPATRALISDAILHNDRADRITNLTRELQAYPEATWNDHLLFLDLLRQQDSPEYISYLTELEKRAGQNAVELGSLLDWMNRHSLGLLAIDFAKTLSAEKRDEWPIPLALANTYLVLKSWDKLEALTKNANWRRFEFLRHAYVARAAREKDKPAISEREWGAASRDAVNDSRSVMILLETVVEWRWIEEATDLLWTLSKWPDRQREALSTLYKHYVTIEDTVGRYRVMQRLSELDPSNLDVKNNVAQIGLLLKVQPEDARRMAAEVYQKMPSNPAYVATYAYSLFQKGDVRGALKIMNSLGNSQLHDPSISAYYGLFLAAAGDERAREFLENGKKARLLPEERKMIEKALAGLANKPETPVVSGSPVG